MHTVVATIAREVGDCLTAVISLRLQCRSLAVLRTQWEYTQGVKNLAVQCE